MRELKIKKSAVMHYFLLYLLLLASGSRIWVVTAMRYSTVATILEVSIILVSVYLMIVNPRKYFFKYVWVELLVLLSFIVIVRLKTGGVGIAIFLEWAAYLLLAQLVVQYDNKSILSRYVNIVYFFAVVSIVGFCLQIVNPKILQSFLPAYDSNFSVYAGMSGQEVIYKAQTAWGRFIFTFDERQVSRNVGIFSEPGVYQIVLNASLFVLLFMKDHVPYSARQYTKRVVVILAALITSQSVTGYLGLIIILTIYYLNVKRDELVARRVVTIAIFSILLFIIFDLSIRGRDGFLYSLFLSRILNDHGLLDLTVSSGLYRMGTITTSISLMWQDPFGIGYDAANDAIQAALHGSTGAIILITGAALGVIPLASIFCWTINPIVRSRIISNGAKVGLILTWLNTALAQSEEFYTGFLVIVLFLVEARNNQNAVRHT